MKKISFMIPILALVLVFFATAIVTGQARKAGINSAAFLKVGVGARQVGMGSAVTSFNGDVTNMFWNPAGVALRDESAQASFTYNSWIGGITQNAFAASLKLEGIGTIGVGVMTFGISGIPADRDVYPLNPDLQALQIDQQSSDTYDYLDLVAQVTYSEYVIDRLVLGASAKLIQEKIDDMSATAIAFDLGSVYNIGLLDWNIGARISNLGSDLKFYDYASPIPLTFSIGMSLTPIRNGESAITVATDAVKPQDGQQYYYTGLEYNYDNTIFLRAGWKLNYSDLGLKGDAIDEGTSQRQGIRTSLEKGSLGAGVRTPMSDYMLTVDYSYTAFTSFSDVHRITLQFSMK
ncbi:MAG: hypothetical protein HW407_1952 [Bacteroidetes bacterium]|nr:hypothetical protein [Bacteroidota bacterium]